MKYLLILLFTFSFTSQANDNQELFEVIQNYCKEAKFFNFKSKGEILKCKDLTFVKMESYFFFLKPTIISFHNDTQLPQSFLNQDNYIAVTKIINEMKQQSKGFYVERERVIDN